MNHETPLAQGPVDVNVGQQQTFYCVNCGRNKDISLAVKRPSGRTLICRSCDEKASRIAKKTDAQRERARLKVTKRGTTHLMPNVEAQGRLTAASLPAGVPLERRVRF